MLNQHQQLIDASLDNTLRNLTTYCLKEKAKAWEKTVAQMSYFGGRMRLDMGFIQQEDVAFVWVDELNTQGLVCTFKLSHFLLCQIANPLLSLQRLKWQLIYPANTVDDIAEVSDTYLLDTALFRRITRDFADDVADILEAAIVEMSF